MAVRNQISSNDVILASLIVAVTASIQALMGQPWWCAGSDLNPWSSDILTFHNSQHLFDPYTFTHALHGVGLYGLLWLTLRHRLGTSARWVTAVGLEAAWEILENTPIIIERYRAETISLGYFGDSIANSIGDIAACAAGFLVAAMLPVWGSVALFAGTEVVLLLWIRDSLLLNIVMLLWPLEWLKEWQQKGGLH